MRVFISRAIGILLCLALAATVYAADHTTDSAETIKKNVQEKKALLLDVREKREWDEGHLEGALLLPVTRLQQGVDPQALAQQLPKDQIIYCHCRAGGRALAAGLVLEKLGYDVRPLKQGYADLIELGFPQAKD